MSRAALYTEAERDAICCGGRERPVVLRGEFVAPLVVATATFGLVEVALHRLATPILVHAAPEGQMEWAKAWTATAGTLAFRATAALAVAGLLLWLLAGRRAGYAGVALAVAALVVSLARTAVPAASVALAGDVLFLAAAVALVAQALRANRDWSTSVLVLALVALTAGRLPLLVDGWSRVTASNITVPRELLTAAEGAVLLVPLVGTAAVVVRVEVPRLAWWAGGLTAVLIGAAVARAPGYVAISAMWASGLTLSLPVATYVLAGAGASMVVAAAPRDQAARWLLLGLSLLFVAGAQPAVVHHNATALLGLAVLAELSGARRGQQVERTSYVAAHLPAAQGSRRDEA